MRLMIFSLLVTTMGWAINPVEIVNAALVGDCANNELKIVKEGGEYFIAAFFPIQAVADAELVEKKSCRAVYQIKFADGFKQDGFEFPIDGHYQLSEHGIARLNISHRIANNTSARTNKYFSIARGDPTEADIKELSGTIAPEELPAIYSKCGADISATMSVYAAAVKPVMDQARITSIGLKKNSAGYVKIGKIGVRPCEG
ncbi:MAG: hypothetical protein V4534_08755 [Myxococcota bacterium]